MTSLKSRIEKAKASLPDSITGPKIGIILGSGLGGFVNTLSVSKSVSYKKIDEFMPSTAPGHEGVLLSATFERSNVLVCQGRLHLYEGYAPQDVVMPVYLLQALGVETLIITNAAGGLNPDYEPGSVIMISDHINMTGQNPLAGIDEPELGVRFPDMSRAYAPHLRDMVHRAHPDIIKEGVYVGVTGPSLETSAERRFYRQAGGDMIGMSTIMEVIAANHCGLNVLGLSIITNKATGGADQQADTLEEVLANAAIGEQKLRVILSNVLKEMTN